MGDADRGPRARRQGKPRPKPDDSVLAEVRKRFKEFRGQHKRFTRIPDTLREAALEALDRGIAPAALRRRCGVTADQLVQWEKERQQARDGGESLVDTTETPRTECFRVVDCEEANDDATTTAAPERLELRIGPWAITIRGL